jgi:hypothetical protein
MKRSFIRVLWGDADLDINNTEYISHVKREGIYMPNEHNLLRRKKIAGNIKRAMAVKHIESFVVYAFGKNNKKCMDDIGVPCVLVDNEPYRHRVFGHKIEAIKWAMEDYDEIVLMDWDTKPAKKLPINFWDELNKKEVFQASLWKHRTPKINHRDTLNANQITPGGGFIYVRDKDVPSKLIDFYQNAPNKWSEQPAYALLTDEMMGGWKGIDAYWKLFEPECYRTKKSPYRWLPDKYFKDPCFVNRGHAWRF